MSEEEVGTGAGEAPEGGPEKEPGLEKRLERLDQIARELEKGEVGLEESLALFEEGVRHVRRAQELLSRAELRVEELVGEGEDAETQPLEGPESGGSGGEPGPGGSEGT